MNYQHQWGQTEEATRVRRTTGRRRIAAPALVTCPRCGCGEYADAIASGDCTGCKRSAKLAARQAAAA